MKISMIGTGYVGLVSGAVFADWGHDVMCLDVDKKKVADINKGVMPIYEDGLEELVKRVSKEGRFIASTEYKKTVEHADIIFICVGTPSNQSGAAELSYVFSASESIGANMKPGDYKIIVTKSTVPVGTHARVRDSVQKGLGDTKAKFDVASNPEFLREGTAIVDANNTDRVVIGSDSDRALEALEGLYAHLSTEILRTDLASAELIKYAANAFIATKITFINEMAQICERTGADVMSVALGMGLDKRIGTRFLHASSGFGGSCFPKDVEALYRTSNDEYYDFRLLRGVMDANERQKHYFLEKVWNKYGQSLEGKTVGVLGTAFKAGTDDVRKSVGIDIIRMIRGAGATVRIFDPKANREAREVLGDEGIVYCNSAEEVFSKLDFVMILTEWPEFRELDYKALAQNMTDKVVYDSRNLLSPKKMNDLGYEYFGIGRGNSEVDVNFYV